MIPLPQWAYLHIDPNRDLRDGLPVLWGFGSTAVGSSKSPCDRCGRKPRAKDGRHIVSFFGPDYVLCSRCLHAAWDEASAGLWYEPELPFTGALLGIVEVEK